jgi:hypothetical protein
MSLPPALKLLETLGYPLLAFVKELPERRPIHKRSTPFDGVSVPKEISSFELADLTVHPVTDEINKYTVTYNTNVWHLEFKVLLTEKDVHACACLAARFAPPNSTVSLQADAHGAGNVYVGMIMTFGYESIPINLVSGDIGCGLSMVPAINSEGEHLNESAIKNPMAFHSYVLATIRRSLKRGKAAEDGATLSQNISKAMAFYGADELGQWLDEMHDILNHVGLEIPNCSVPVETGLTEQQSQTLQYIGRYAQSLGSSGNHFLELCTDEQGYYWFVVHSGSRGLGSKVYEAVAGACRLLTDGLEIATGELAVFYARIYDALNKFAKLNRILCALAVADALHFATDASILHSAMRRSFIFAPAIDQVSDEAAVLSLMSGLTHNGLKAYVNDEAKQVLFVLSKGAIAMTKRGSASIVALRAGDGCYVWTLADPKCPWYEQRIQDAVSKVHASYLPIHKSPDIIYSGHGAGRSQATNKTAAASTFSDVDAFYVEAGIVGNIAPGVLGDNPRIAYNDVPTILTHLPLDIAATKSQLKTRVTYKEGIVTWPKTIVEQCADYIVNIWHVSDDNKKMWLDLNLCLSSSHKDIIKTFVEERDKIYESLKVEYENGDYFRVPS